MSADMNVGPNCSIIVLKADEEFGVIVAQVGFSSSEEGTDPDLIALLEQITYGITGAVAAADDKLADYGIAVQLGMSIAHRVDDSDQTVNLIDGEEYDAVKESLKDHDGGHLINFKPKNPKGH